MIRRLVVLLAFALLASFAWLARPLTPVAAPVFHAAADYDEAQMRLFDVLGRDSVALHPGCGTLALLTGHRTRHAYVLMHGITNCPLQFEALAESLRADTDNVIVPRLDHHGRADRMTPDLANLTAEEFAALVTECAGIARGFGDTVVVCGLSSSGVAAAWAAANLDVDRVVALAPAFAPPWKPAAIAPVLTRLALRLPNRFVWWDDRKREALDGPSQCYVRFSTHAMAEGYRLGEATMVALASGRPKVREVDVVTTAADRAIDNGRAERLAARCAALGVRVRTHTFPAGPRIVHDMVDPRQVGARTDVTYPVLLAMLRGRPLPDGR